MPRFFGAWDARQEASGTLIYSEDDARRVLTQAATDATVRALIFADDFTITRTLTIPLECAGIEIYAAPGITIRGKTGADPVFDIQAPLVRMCGFDLISDGSSGSAIRISAALHVSVDHCLVNGIRFLTKDGTTSPFFAKAVEIVNATVSYCEVSDCEFQTQMGVTSASFTVSVLRCRRTTSFSFTASSPFCTLDARPTYIGNSGMNVGVVGSIGLPGGRVENNETCTITLGANISKVSIVGNSGATTIDTSASGGNNRLAGNSGVTTKTLHATDIDDDAPTGRLIRAPQVLTSGTSYAKPAGCNAILVEAIGGGGGGGGASSAAVNAAAGAGGSAGAYCRKYYDVSALAGPFTYAIGGGGAAGANTGGNGGSGGDSTFTDGTTLVTAGGGLGGNGMTAGTALGYSQGKSGGVPTNGDVNARGQPGEPGLRHSGTVAASGGAGSGPFGGGGVARITATAGLDGNGPGSGGSGGCVLNGSGAVTGGAGDSGVIIVWEFS